MHPLTLRFASSAVEAAYRQQLFAQSHKWLAGIAGTTAAMQLVDVAQGKAAAGASIVLLAVQNAPRLGRVLVYRRGDRTRDVERFRHAYLLYSLALLLAKLFFPWYVGGAAEGDTSLEVWMFPQPLFLRMQGPDTTLCWLLSAAALSLSYVAPAWTWRADHEADASALRDAVLAGELAAYFFDWGLRAQHLRAQTARRNEPPPV